MAWFLLAALLAALPLNAQDVTLPGLVTPSTVFTKDRKPIRFALYGLIEFDSLEQMFAYIDRDAGRRHLATAAERQAYGDVLLARGVESRVVSMAWEEPLETLLRHSREELNHEVLRLPKPMFQGRNWRLNSNTYRDAFARVREKWSKALNCWSASPSPEGRVLSNWYAIPEGIELYGASYDSTEHFWQAVKYHPAVTVRDLLGLLSAMEAIDWTTWLEQLESGRELYLQHAHAVEFLRANLTIEKRARFRFELQALEPAASARQLQQRDPTKMRFTPLQEKTLWGDLADLFHLLYFFQAPVRPALARQHFDAVYLGNRPVGFLSPEFQAVMLEIWKVKFLKNPRLGEVIRSIPREIRLEHFLNGGDSPDIPLSVYVEYLNQIRDLAWSRD